MPELTTSDRLQPALLDRLTDDQPQALQESRDRRVISMRQLREAVLRDLTFLLNTPCRPSGDELYEYPRVAASVLNFGLPDVTGLAASGISPEKMEQMVLDAVRRYEPRIMRDTLSVRAAAAEGKRGPNVLQFQISGELCPLPMPEALFLRTEVDLETGRAEVKE